MTVDPACPAGTFPPAVVGLPRLAAGSATILYLWVEKNGIVHLQTTHPGNEPMTFTGTITTTGTFVSWTGVYLERPPDGEDTFTINSARTQLSFSFQNLGDLDGVNFALSCTATITFDFQADGAQLPTSAIYIGPQHFSPPSNPFSGSIPANGGQ